MSSDSRPQHIRSFTNRRVHFTIGQRAAHERLLPQLGGPLGGAQAGFRVLVLGVVVGQHAEGVATRDGERYYGIPYGRKQILKITAATSSAELIPKPLNGSWN
jgi:hypothetical protein